MLKLKELIIMFNPPREINTVIQPKSKLSDIFNEREKTLIIGAGEIGKSLSNVLAPEYDVRMIDIEPDEEVDKYKYKVINICYPYSDKFIEITRQYIEKYKPELTIIHSTVKPGTTQQLGKGVVHSPVNGRHPNLEEGIKTFVKFIGGDNVFDVFRAVAYLGKVGIKTQAFANSMTSELAKVLCTTYYGWNLLFMKEVARICQQMNVPFQEVYTEWNNAYNDGYAQLKEFRFFRPVLFPMDGPIGGHCVIPNCDLFDDFLTQTVKGRNELYKKHDENKRFPVKRKRN